MPLSEIYILTMPVTLVSDIWTGVSSSSQLGPSVDLAIVALDSWTSRTRRLLVRDCRRALRAAVDRPVDLWRLA